MYYNRNQLDFFYKKYLLKNKEIKLKLKIIIIESKPDLFEEF
jgi:hypothetical protein